MTEPVCSHVLAWSAWPCQKWPCCERPCGYAASSYATNGHAASSTHAGVHAASGHANDRHAVNGTSIYIDGQTESVGVCECAFEFSGHSVSGLLYAQPRLAASTREQLLQDQLQREHQEFQALKLEVSKNLVPTQPQAQAPSLVDLTEPPMDIDTPVEVIDKPQRSASVKRSRS